MIELADDIANHTRWFDTDTRWFNRLGRSGFSQRGFQGIFMFRDPSLAWSWGWW